MSPRRSVLFVTDGIFPYATGGMQKYVKDLIIRLEKTNLIDISVIHPHFQKIFSPSIREIYVPPIKQEKIYIFELLRYSQDVYKKIDVSEYDIIFVNGLSLRIKKEISHKTIFHPHGANSLTIKGISNQVKTAPLKKLTTHNLQKARIIISHCHYFTQLFSHYIDKKKVVEIGNAVDMQICQEVNDRSPSVLAVSRIAELKGIEKIIKVAELMPHVQFNIVGEGPLLEKYRNLSTPLLNVTFHGPLYNEDLSEMYRKNSLFLLPSESEGMPMVVIEAMSYGVPVIASYTGCVEEMIPNKDFILYRNTPEEIKEKIERFLRLSVVAQKRISDEFYQFYFQNFTWDKVIEKYIELFYLV